MKTNIQIKTIKCNSHKLYNVKDWIIVEKRLERCNENTSRTRLELRLCPKLLEIKDILQFKDLVNTIQNVFDNNKYISEKGYLNDPLLELPITILLVEKYKESKHSYKENGTFSIGMNVLCNHVFMVFLLELLVKLHKKYQEEFKPNKEDLDFYLDLEADMLNIRNSIKATLHNHIKNLITNKGISITSKTFVGFDSEYELLSQSQWKNTLLSIQLAGIHEMILKVPQTGDVSIKPEYLSTEFFSSEQELKSFFKECLNNSINNIRKTLYQEQFLMLDDLTTFLEAKDVEKGDEKGMNIQPQWISPYKYYRFPKSSEKTLVKYDIKYLSKDVINEFNLESLSLHDGKYSSKELIKDSEDLHKERHIEQLIYLINILNKTCDMEMTDYMLQKINNTSGKAISRITYKASHGVTLSITINRDTYLCIHESAADLSMLSDMDEFKIDLDLIGRSLITIGRPLRFEWSSSRLFIRDTILLAPGGSKSLKGLGKLYGEGYNKINIGGYRGGGMLELLKTNFPLFKEYATRDAVITLKHSIEMDEFNYKIGKIGVPLTLSSIGKNYVLREWKRMRYEGYKVRHGLNMGNLASNISPVEARSEKFNLFISSYIQCYRGGRNESFMFGFEQNKENTWYDYDLTSCYTTVMCLLGHPNKEKATRVWNKQILEMYETDKEKLLFSFITLEVEFKFPNSVKYPCIPTRVDDVIDIYPQQGVSVITGAEYLVAKSMGCQLIVKSGVMVPLMRKNEMVEKGILPRNWIHKEKEKEKQKESLSKEPKRKLNKVFEYFSPYRSIIQELQRLRRQHPPKTFGNLMYKEIGNSIYGQVAMGISNKKSKNPITKQTVKIQGGELSNPLLATFITGFTRAVIGECLNNIQKLNGRVVSVTTDGFITDVKDLEMKMLALKDPNSTYCLKVFSDIRTFLTTIEGDPKEPDPRSLEVKHEESEGIMSIKTRGQIGYSENGIIALTGYQSRGVDRIFLLDTFRGYLIDGKSPNNYEYIQSSLRSGRDILSKGGSMVEVNRDMSYNLSYDNKRCIISNNSETILDTNTLLDSVAWKNVEEFGRIKSLSETVVKKPYSRIHMNTITKEYKTDIEKSVRSFIKACYAKDQTGRYGIQEGHFDSYEALIKFIYHYEPARLVKLTKQSISNLRHRNTIPRSVKRSEVNIGFIQYVKEKFPKFEDDRFFKE